jgi:hypothetical protein
LYFCRLESDSCSISITSNRMHHPRLLRWRNNPGWIHHNKGRNNSSNRSPQKTNSRVTKLFIGHFSFHETNFKDFIWNTISHSVLIGIYNSIKWEFHISYSLLLKLQFWKKLFQKYILQSLLNFFETKNWNWKKYFGTSNQTGQNILFKRAALNNFWKKFSVSKL